MASKKKWIQGAINPEHKGYCTPMTKSTCTPRRKALARTLKKMAKKRPDGGTIMPTDSTVISNDTIGYQYKYPIEKHKIKTSRVDAVFGLKNQGVNNSKDILNYLNFDEHGNKIGDFTIEEVDSILNKYPSKNYDANIKRLSKGGIIDYANGGLSRKEDYGSEKKPYPSVKSSDFAGGGRSYPIPTKADAVDALRLAGLHGRSDVKAKVYKKYPELKKSKKYQYGGEVPLSAYQIRDNYQYMNPSTPALGGDYNFSSGNYLNNYDLEGSLTNSYSQIPQQQPNAIQSNSGTLSTIGAAGNIASGLIDSTSDNAYNQQYGFQQSSVAGAAESTPIGSAIGGAANLLGSVAESAGAVDYNQYGVNEAGDTSGQIYSAVGASLDPYAQLEKDVSEGDWWSAAGTLLGGQTVTGILQYDQEQEEAKKREAEARRMENKMKRAMRDRTPTVTYQPTVTYPYGGTVDDVNMSEIGQLQTKPIQIKNVPQTTSGLRMPSGYTYVHQADPTKATAHFTPHNWRPQTATNTRYVLQNELGVDPGTIPSTLTDEYLAQYAQPSKYRVGKSSTGESVLEVNMPSKAARQEVFAKGGMVNANAELETDEVYRTPDGEIEEVPEGTPSHANGGVKMNLPEGTEILGKMKGKHTNGKRYKDLGQDLKRRHDKYQSVIDNPKSNKLAIRTAERMMDKVQMEYDELMEDQEIQKFCRGGRTRRKTRFPDGGNVIQEPENYVPEISYGIPLNYFYDFNMLYDYGKNRDFSTYENPYYGEDAAAISGDVTGELPRTGRIAPTRGKAWWERNKEDIGTTLGTAAQFAPTAYNLYQGMFGRPDYLDESLAQNTYNRLAMQKLGDIDYNIQPELTANELAYQAARRNVRQLAPGTGALLSNYGALAGTRMRADAEAYARKQNMENQYRAQQAGILSQIGSQDIRNRLAIEQYNAQVDAAKQAALSEGLYQVGDIAGQMLATKSKKESDALKIKALQAYANKYNIDPSDYNAFMNLIQ